MTDDIEGRQLTIQSLSVLLLWQQHPTMPAGPAYVTGPDRLFRSQKPLCDVISAVYEIEESVHAFCGNFVKEPEDGFSSATMLADTTTDGFSACEEFACGDSIQIVAQVSERKQHG